MVRGMAIEKMCCGGSTRGHRVGGGGDGGGGGGREEQRGTREGDTVSYEIAAALSSLLAVSPASCGHGRCVRPIRTARADHAAHLALQPLEAPTPPHPTTAEQQALQGPAGGRSSAGSGLHPLWSLSWTA